MAILVAAVAAILFHFLVLHEPGRQADRSRPAKEPVPQAPVTQSPAAPPAAAETPPPREGPPAAARDALPAPAPAPARPPAPTAGAARAEAAASGRSARSDPSLPPPSGGAISLPVPAPPAAPPAPPPPSAPQEPSPKGSRPRSHAERAGLTGAIRGSLLDRRGRSLASTSVVALSTDGLDAAETITDDEGSFLLAGLRPGRYAVFAGLDTGLSSRLGARAVQVRPAEVSRLDLRERPKGATVRVTARDAKGRLAAAQAVLVSGAPSEPGSFGSLLASDAIYLPLPQAPRTVLADVPEGVYTLVILQGPGQPIRAAWEPVRVTGDAEIVLEVELGSLDPRG